MERSEYFRAWSALHGGVVPGGLVGGWLRLVHAVATPLVRLRVSPGAVTVLGAAIACATPVLAGAGRPGMVAAAALIAGSGLVDSLDGAVAVMTGRVTRWGAVLDGVADRVGDAAFAAALGAAGAPAPVCVAAVGLAWLQEYARARAAAAGLSDVAVLTVNERPTRVIVVVMSLLAAASRPADNLSWPTLGSWALVGLGAVGLLQLLVVARRRLGSAG